MISKEITYNQLKEAIRISFENDKHITSVYDPNVKVESIDDIVNDVLRKLSDYPSLEYRGIYDKQKLVGYFVRKGGMLISFSICVEYRVRKFKRNFFSLIKEDFKGMFICFLWSKNVRAIRWLLKMGMEEMHSDNLLTKLICR